MPVDEQMPMAVDLLTGHSLTQGIGLDKMLILYVSGAKARTARPTSRAKSASSSILRRRLCGSVTCYIVASSGFEMIRG